jgi:hypothetical protein
MARRSKQAVLKRQRERKKAEKAAAKREEKARRQAEESDGSRVASAEDLAGYGLADESEDDREG